MSGEDSNDGGGFSMAGLFWGNVGEGNQLDVDYMEKDALASLANVTDIPHELQLQRDGTAGPSQQVGDAVRAAADAVNFEDEPTLSEDLEDDDDEAGPAKKAAAAAAPPAAGAPPAARPSFAAAVPGHVAANGTWLADEDDYDADACNRQVTATSAAQAPAATSFAPAAAAAASYAAAAASAAADNRSWDGHQAAAAASAQQQASYGVQQTVATPASAPAATAAAASQAAPGQLAAVQLQGQAAAVVESAAQQALRQENERKAAQQRQLGFSYLGRADGQEVISYSELFLPREQELRRAQEYATGQDDAAYPRRVERAARRAAALHAREAADFAAAAAEQEEEDEGELLRLRDLEQLLPSLGLQDATEVVTEDEDEDEELPGSWQRGRAAAAEPTRGKAAAAAKKAARADCTAEQGKQQEQQQQQQQPKKLQQAQKDPSAPIQQAGALGREPSGDGSGVAEQGVEHRGAAAGAGVADLAAVIGDAVVLDDWEAGVIWDAHGAVGGRGVAPAVREQEKDAEAEEDAMLVDQLAERRASHAGASSSHPPPAAARHSPSRNLSSSNGSSSLPGLRRLPPALQHTAARMAWHPRMLRLAPSFAALEAAEAAARAAAEAAAAVAQQGGEQQGANAAAGSASAAPRVVGAAAASAAAAAAKRQAKGEEILADAAAGAAAAAEQLRIRVAGDLLSKPVVTELLGDDWEKAVLFDGAQKGSGAPKPILWNLNDPHMVFESEKAREFEDASAVVQLPPPKVKVVLPPSAAREEDPTALALAHLNTSKDHLYAATRKAKADKSIGFATRHSIPALALKSLPLYPNDAFTPHWHRPRAAFSAAAHYPMAVALASGGKSKKKREAAAAAAAEGKVTVQFSSLAGLLKSASTTGGDGWRQPLATFWQSVSSKGGFNEKGVDEAPLLMGGRPFQSLDVTRSLAELGLDAPINTVIPVWRTLSPLHTTAHCSLRPPDSEEPRRPPGAFKTTKSLTARSGHLLLVEYYEERPLMLLQPGMGLKLVTYYQRRGEDDMGHQQLQEEYNAGVEAYQAPPLHSSEPDDGLKRPYMVGAVHPLMPEEPSPFHDMHHMPPGATQYVVETPNFRAPAAPHVPNSSDFVLVRSATGAMHLREATGCVLVGQQHPNVRVMVPSSTEAKEFEANHFQVHVLRALRNRQERLVKNGAGEVATITVAELEDKFRAILAGRDMVVKQQLRDKCFCVPVPDKNEASWTIREGAKVPVEQELRKLVTPDMYCQYEGLCAGLQWPRDVGLKHSDQPPVAPERLRLALEALPQDPDSRQAAIMIELSQLASPWKLSDAYMTVIREKKLASLLMGGIGDPTARGKGFSFIKEDIKRGRHDAPGFGVQTREDGTITGTDADLRKLGHKDAGELLVSKFSMPRATVDALGRWERINHIRTFCRDPSFAHIVNADPALAQYVRGVRVSAAENLQKLRQQAARIFAAQMDALHEDWDTEPMPEPVDLFGPISGANDGSNAAGPSLGGTRAAAAGGRQQFDEDQAYYEQMRSSGMVRGKLASSRPGGPAVPPARLEAAPGDRRIRRIITYPGPDGQPVEREIIYTDRDKIAALNAMYRSSEGFGERRIPRPGQKRPKREAAVAAPGLPAAPALTLPAAAEPVPPAWLPAAHAAPAPAKAKPKKPRASKAASAHASAAARRASKRPTKKRARGSGDDEYEDITDSQEDDGAIETSDSESLDAGALDVDSEGGDSPVASGKGRRAVSGAAAKAKKPKRQRTAKSARAASDEDSEGGGGDEDAWDGSAEVEAAGGEAGAELGGQQEAGAAAAADGPAAQLNWLLGSITKQLLEWQKPKGNNFAKQVPVSLVPDYHQWVQAKDEMWLDKILSRTRGKRYQSLYEFRKDVQQIAKNAAAYNSNPSKHRTPFLVQQGQELVQHAEQLIAAQVDILNYWSNMAQVEAVNKARSNPSRHASQLAKAREQAAAVGGDVAPAGWQWIECETCKQWRLMTLALYEEMGLDKEGSHFVCSMDRERLDAGCDAPQDYFQ